MRDRWKAEVDQALSGALDRMQERLNERPKLDFDQAKFRLDIIVPKFVVRPRLHHFATGPTSMLDKSMAKAIREIWTDVRNAHPELWTYASWYQQHMKSNPDTQELSEGDFAERMRRKRDGRKQQQEEASEETCAPCQVGTVEEVD